MSDKIGKYYWVRTEAGKEIAFKRDSGLWELHGVDCLENCKEAILEVYGEVANGDDKSTDPALHKHIVKGSALKAPLTFKQAAQAMHDFGIAAKKWLESEEYKKVSDAVKRVS